MTVPRQAGAHKVPPKNRESALSPARQAAFQILLKLEGGKAHCDTLLRSKSVDALGAADRHLATALVLGVVRWQIQLDAQIQPLLTRPGGKLDAEVRIALRMGAFQILHMDRVPARAAIDESVELAKQAGHRFAAGMVNAVLRKLAGGKRRVFGEGDAAEIALAEAHPLWMVERWATNYGLDGARAICRHGQEQPRLALRLAGPAVEQELGKAGITLEPGILLTQARRVAAGDLAGAHAMGEERVRIQDEGSQLLAEIAAAALERLEGKILDACAAPGGKTLILAERHAGVSIMACESNPKRLAELRERVGGMAGQIDCCLADVTALAEEAVFDLVLADVPCSGTGTLGRNPEIRHRLRAEDLLRQAERQREILRAALRLVRPGGRVVYSTCSLEPEENEWVLEAVLRDSDQYRAVALGQTIEEMVGSAVLLPAAGERLKASLTGAGAMRLLPGEFHSDGFFIALLERIDSIAIQERV